MNNTRQFVRFTPYAFTLIDIELDAKKNLHVWIWK